LDELMIQWNGLPEDSDVTVYLPSLDADEILAAAARRSGPQRLEKVDAHTVRCLVGDVSYIPLPAPAPTHVAGLITIRLPETVKVGERYNVVVRQVGGLPRYVVGTFELFIAVSTSEKIRPEEERTLSVLKHIAGTIKPSSRWHAVFQRYLAVLNDKVRGVGGSPGDIDPSTTGEPGTTDDKDPKAERCCRLAWWMVALIALFIVMTVLFIVPAGSLILAIIALVLAVLFVIWLRTCACMKTDNQ
jgi:hypothetical protein